MAGIEHSIQTACVRWFRIQYPQYASVFFAVPNAGRRTRWEIAQLKQEGLVAGVADTLLLISRHGYHGLCVEFKYEVEEYVKGRRTLRKTYQEPEQREWQAAVEAQGYRYEVVRSFVEFQALVRMYLDDKSA